MEINFSQLKQKDVVSLADGKNLGKVSDIGLCFPENRVTGLFVSGGSRIFRFLRQEIFLPVNCIVRIGEDAVLVNFSPKDAPPKACPPPQPPSPVPPPPPPKPRRNFDEYE